MLNLLEIHFKSHDFLLGGMPSIGDFGLVGPIIPHLARDPYPKEYLLNEKKYPNIYKWINRMKNPENLIYNETINDYIPETLNPILYHVFNEFIPMIKQMIDPVLELKLNHKFYNIHDKINPAQKSLPRKLGVIKFPLIIKNENQNTYNKLQYKRSVLPFNLYKMQLVLDEYHKMSIMDKQHIRNYLTNFNENCSTTNYCTEILDMQLPQLKRHNVRVKFA